MFPVERFPVLPRSVSLYQPVYRTLMESDSAKEYLENDWVTNLSANFQLGYGKLFLQKDRSVRVYPDLSSPNWIPTENWKVWEMVNRVPEYVYRRLSKDFEHAISITSSKHQRKHMRRQAVMISMMGKAILQSIKESALRIRDKT